MSFVYCCILLGVFGGIVVYKFCELVCCLCDVGVEVCVVMIEGVMYFVILIMFQVFFGVLVWVLLWDELVEVVMGYIELVCWVECIFVVLVSVDVLVCLVYGQVDDLLIMLCLVSVVLLLVVLVMNQQMWVYLVVQVNLVMLCECGVIVLGLVVGEQVCGDVGFGCMFELLELCDVLVVLFGGGVLVGCCVVVSVGLIYEDIDLVCFIGNCSLGKMGFVVVEVVVQVGVYVILVVGLVSLFMFSGVVVCVDVCSVVQMYVVVIEVVVMVDIYIVVVVVGDYCLQQVVLCKFKKQVGVELMFMLVENLDIFVMLLVQLMYLFLVGFVVEMYDVVSYVQDKLCCKKLDMIVVNQVGGGMGFEIVDNVFMLYWVDGLWELLCVSKIELVCELIVCVVEYFKQVCV